MAELILFRNAGMPAWLTAAADISYSVVVPDWHSGSMSNSLPLCLYSTSTTNSVLFMQLWYGFRW